MEKRLAIFAGYDSKNRIDEYVIHYLKDLKKVADIVFVYDNEFSAKELSKISDLTIHQICEKHGEYDFGSYKRGYVWAKNQNILNQYDSLIFCNDSMFGPFYSMEPIFDKFEKKEDVDFWGMFCQHNRKTPFYVHSFFLVLKKQVLKQKDVMHFIVSITKESRKIDIIRKYEVGFSQLLLNKGFKGDALFKSAKNDPNDRRALHIIEMGFPYLKKALFDSKAVANCANLRNYKDALNQIETTYDLSLIDRYLDRYIGKEDIEVSFRKSRLKSLKRFFFQKKTDKNENVIIKVCKIQIYKKKARQTPTPVSDIFVSVVMPVYNGSLYVGETIESILNQTHQNFEFVIVDDCSTDNSYEILKKYTKLDKRIKLFRTPKNYGNPGGTSAYGVTQVSPEAKYIIMTDQDDISVNKRLELQLRFMENNPHVDISGGRMKLFGRKSRYTRPPKKDDEIKARLLTSSPIANPTLVLRKRFLDAHKLNYKNQTSHDYRLLAEAALDYKAVFHNLQTIVLLYRCHENQTSSSQSATIKESSNQIRTYQLKKLGVEDVSQINFFNKWKAKKIKITKQDLQKLKTLFEKILLLNKDNRLYPQKALTKRLFYLYHKECIRMGHLSSVVHLMLYRFKTSKSSFCKSG